MTRVFLWQQRQAKGGGGGGGKEGEGQPAQASPSDRRGKRRPRNADPLLFGKRNQGHGRTFPRFCEKVPNETTISSIQIFPASKKIKTKINKTKKKK